MTEFLQELRAKNAERADAWNKRPTVPFNELEFRTIEFAGEAGELCNAVKKYLRMLNGIQGNTETNIEVLTNLREEVGDVLICLDRVAEALGINVEKATRSKFNKTSKKVNIDVRL